jgi:putative transposase
MPWKTKDKIQQRWDLVRQMAASKIPVSELCRCFGVSRQTAYKWRKCFRLRGLDGLRDKSRRPLSLALQTSSRWLRRVRRLRRRAGPQLRRRAVRISRGCHDVWTVDFKGSYCLGDGTRVSPLTVRDLHSRYGLAIALLRSQATGPTKKEFRRLFLRQGLPRRIRCDNGSPFGAIGTTGLTRLSAWWVKLGIEVEFITPGRPCENGAHEQFHRVYEGEVARKPERTRLAQQRRGDRWLKDYNEHRPHEGIALRRPAELFGRNRRRLPKRIGPWKYPAGWVRRWVKGNGEINWRGVRRYVGESFVRDYVGMKPMGPRKWKVYFGPILVGELREKESGSIRMARYRRRRWHWVPPAPFRLACARLHFADGTQCQRCREHVCQRCRDTLQCDALPTRLAHGVAAWIAYAMEGRSKADIAGMVRATVEGPSGRTPALPTQD